MKRNSHFFQTFFDGTTYRQVYRLDPRLLIPGLMVTAVSVPLMIVTWPVRLAWLIPALGLALTGAAFLKRHELEVTPSGYRIRWSLGPFGWTSRISPDEAIFTLVGGGDGHYSVLICRGTRTFEPLVYAAKRCEAEQWINFLRRVAAGQPAEPPQS